MDTLEYLFVAAILLVLVMGGLALARVVRSAGPVLGWAKQQQEETRARVARATALQEQSAERQREALELARKSLEEQEETNRLLRELLSRWQ